MGPIDRVMVEASAQYGAISVAQMRECGLTWKAQRSAISRGQLVLVESCVAVIAGAPDSWHRRLQVGLLALGPQGWVSHEAAAALHRLDRTLRGPLDFTVPRGVHRTLTSGRVHTTAHVGPLDVLTVEGLRCSSATRTIIDLAYLAIPMIRLAAAIDSSVHRGLSATRVLKNGSVSFADTGDVGW